MSAEYDNYIRQHKENLLRGLEWMQQNLPDSLINGEKMVDALANAEIHDQSKYSKEEYDAYDAYFYGDKYTDIPGERPPEVQSDFDRAWLHHIHNNPHHWQHWVLLEDDPSIGSFGKILEMPEEYIYEMIADWWTFSWRDNNLLEMFSWYEQHAERIMLATRTRLVVERILAQIYAVLKMQTILDGRDNVQTFIFADYERMPEDPDFEVVMHSELSDEEIKKRKYGLPELRKFPMPDARHVRSAIRFFNYVDPEHEEELANAILARMKEYGMSFDDFGVGDENRFKKYMPKEEREKE